ncbi:zinc-binding oxidoreductase-like protein ToxD [Lipomyces doorenjongii]
MREAIVAAGPKVTVIESPIPIPTGNKVLIKVVVSGSNPKDWKRPEWFKIAHNSGDDIAGIVEAVGENVLGFRKGDCVAALHEMMPPGGGELCGNISFEEVHKSVLSTSTAALGLYKRMDLPPPWRPAIIPLIIYGEAGAVGSFAIKLAQASNIHPILAVAGHSKEYVESLINRDKGDSIIDYRLGRERVVEEINKALSNSGVEQVAHAYDASGTGFKWAMVLVLPFRDFSDIRKDITVYQSAVASIFGQGTTVEVGDQDFGWIFFRLFEKGSRDGWFTPHPLETIPGGLDGVEKGLANLKAGKNRAFKYECRIN